MAGLTFKYGTPTFNPERFSSVTPAGKPVKETSTVRPAAAAPSLRTRTSAAYRFVTGSKRTLLTSTLSVADTVVPPNASDAPGATSSSAAGNAGPAAPAGLTEFRRFDTVTVAPCRRRY